MRSQLVAASLQRAGLAVAAFGTALSTMAAAQEPAAKPRSLSLENRAWSGDFDGMLERRLIRVLAPYSRTFYFNDKGRERGISADFVRDFEKAVNQTHAKELGKRPVTMVIVPTTRDKLFAWVAAGFGDIAVGNLTVTEERRKVVDFFAPSSMAMSEVVVTGARSPAIATADDLSGVTVHVRKSSSYYESLVALNDRLKKGGKKPANLVLVPEALEDEDLMEMLAAGVVQVIVVDDIVAKMWAQVLKITVHPEAAVRTGNIGGWAIRKNSPKLLKALQDAYDRYAKKQNLLASRLAQYNRRVKQLRDPTTSKDYKRFEETIGLFRKYGKKYSFDPLMLAAQGYQESRLDQQAKGQGGAVGIMQVMPETGAELKVGDIHLTEPNIHAGAKYMDHLMTEYFSDAKFDDTNHSLFAFASYNCGPGNISRMREDAVKRALDPDVWFNNVEVVTAAKIGIQTTTYVRNIYKYYVAYKLMGDIEEARKKALESVK